MAYRRRQAELRERDQRIAELDALLCEYADEHRDTRRFYPYCECSKCRRLTALRRKAGG